MDKSQLTLVKTDGADEAWFYGALFRTFADQVDTIKQSAYTLYMEALEKGIDPEDMDADFSLVTLSLAEESNVSNIDGVPIVTFFNPVKDAQRDKVKNFLLGFDDEDEDEGA